MWQYSFSRRFEVAVDDRIIDGRTVEICSSRLQCIQKNKREIVIGKIDSRVIMIAKSEKSLYIYMCICRFRFYLVFFLVMRKMNKKQ